MPTQTFFNLPEEKRRAIVEIAVEEFAAHDYRSVSISRIVERAGIAKGSFYQYFADKKDLHMYLLQLAGEEKLKMLAGLRPPEGQTSFFDFYRWAVSAGLQFEAEHPQLSRMAYRALYGELPHRDETYARLKQQSHDYLKRQIQEAVDRGELDPAIDVDLAAFIFSVATAELSTYIFQRLAINPVELAEKGTRKSWDLEQLTPIFNSFFYILEKGMGSKN
ncbi:MAG: TetR/AcrR family transcriptional regulator [Bacillota bacterium]